MIGLDVSCKARRPSETLEQAEREGWTALRRSVSQEKAAIAAFLKSHPDRGSTIRMTRERHKHGHVCHVPRRVYDKNLMLVQ